MILPLYRLTEMHPKLMGQAAGLARLGAIAMQRSGHSTPAQAALHESKEVSLVQVAWDEQDMTNLAVLDANRVAEDGAEAIALAYAHAKSG